MAVIIDNLHNCELMVSDNEDAVKDYLILLNYDQLIAVHAVCLTWSGLHPPFSIRILTTS